MMIFRNFHFQIREGSLQFLCQHCHHRVFRMEMAGIDEIHTKILGIPELIVLYICGDEGVAASLHCSPQFAGTCATAHSNLTDRLTAIYIS